MSVDQSRSIRPQTRIGRQWVYLSLSVVVSTIVLLGLLSWMASASVDARPLAPAAPIPPPEGYPKLNQSTKQVTPTLAPVGGAVLTYAIEIRNTGATTATDVTLVDTLPDGVTYNGDGPFQTVTGQTLVWTGTVGFDATVIVSFSVSVEADLVGTLRNTAVISDPHAPRPVTMTAETVVTDEPILTIEKRSSPAKPGANQPLLYELSVTNWGQPMVDQPITVTDQVPLDTTLLKVGRYGSTNAVSDVVTWTRQLSLDLGQSTHFTFSVQVGDVPSGTVIANENYAVAASFGVTTGQPHTVTIIDPIFVLSKRVWPDPPGSNREMTYTLTLLNIGSMATDLVITDSVPEGVGYVRGGTASLPVVRWEWPSLDTGESAEFTFTVYISDVVKMPIINDDYWVCSAQDVCQGGEVLTSVVQGPKFSAKVVFDPHPAVKSPGGSYDVTPTLVIHNVGPGNALDAMAMLEFNRIKAWINDLEIIPAPAEPWPGDETVYDCGDKCGYYIWVGDLDYGETVTFTTQLDRKGYRGVSTIGGEEGTTFTATIVVTDELTTRVGDQVKPFTTPPVTGTAVGTVTHFANLRPIKEAPPVVAPGQLLTYTIHVINTGQSTDQPPLPWMWDLVPEGTSVVYISDAGVTRTVTGTLQGTVISWTLPAMNTGDEAYYTFTVRVDDDLVSGTKVVNSHYQTFWWQDLDQKIFSRAGKPVTTTVQEVGLIDSFKVVTPQLSLPGPDNVLTYYIHLVNSSALLLRNVTAHDLLPWADSTYQKDAVASAGTLISDIVSIDWKGDIEPLSEVLITASVLVDEEFEGVLTNTVVLSHADLSAPVERHAIAYITTRPVLFIQKTATPDPVALGEQLSYRLRVSNMGQPATLLVITDVVPGNVTYVPGSAGTGVRDGDTLRWNWPVLKPGDQIDVGFQVTVEEGSQVVNALYGVRSDEGILALGSPVVTTIKGGGKIYLPLVLKAASGR